MSNKTVMSFKIDKDVRDRARKAAKALGLPLSTVVNQNLKQFAEMPVITFGGEHLLPKVAEEIRRDLADMKRGKNVSPAFKNMTEAITWLNK